MTFIFKDRKKLETLVLLPGWAMDTQIFANLNLEYNYLVPEKVNPFTFEAKLLTFLKKSNLEKISLIGFSLGGFIAFNFAKKYPKIVQNLFLISIRKQYQKKELEQILSLIKKNKNGFLIDFYKNCFYSIADYLKFKKTLLPQYLKIPFSELAQGLDYLAKNQVDLKTLANLDNTYVFHGKYDKIAPLIEVKDLVAQVNNINFTIVDEGHLFMSLSQNGNFRETSALKTFFEGP
ncbi:MAG: alpha/beta fold hydrolase [Candidatus Margulisiibacteriota bacterium]|jgi:malonyl-CoA O-methyltransferase